MSEVTDINSESNDPQRIAIGSEQTITTHSGIYSNSALPRAEETNSDPDPSDNNNFETDENNNFVIQEGVIPDVRPREPFLELVFVHILPDEDLSALTELIISSQGEGQQFSTTIPGIWSNPHPFWLTKHWYFANT